MRIGQALEHGYHQNVESSEYYFSRLSQLAEYGYPVCIAVSRTRQECLEYYSLRLSQLSEYS